jgi:hypothetical protein
MIVVVCRRVGVEDANIAHSCWSRQSRWGRDDDVDGVIVVLNEEEAGRRRAIEPEGSRGRSECLGVSSPKVRRHMQRVELLVDDEDSISKMKTLCRHMAQQRLHNTAIDA